MKKVILFWSGGKDSALALWHLRQNPEIEVVALITTLSEETNSNEIHGLPESLYSEQAKLLNLSLIRIYLPKNPTNSDYEKAIQSKLNLLKKSGVSALAFGDIHLKDIREYREKLCERLGFTTEFPLWDKNSKELLNIFFESGFKALVTSVYREKLDTSFLNKEFSRDWVESLPKSIDPMGEHGEFHTIITFMPGFKHRLNYSKTRAIEVGPYLVTQTREA